MLYLSKGRNVFSGYLNDFQMNCPLRPSNGAEFLQVQEKHERLVGCKCKDN